MNRTKRQQAFDLFRVNKGKITNVEISDKLGLSAATVGSWKSRDKWIENTAGEFRIEKKPKNVIAKEKTKREKDREQVIESLSEIGNYSTALDLLIEIYLDCLEEYREAKENGAQTEKLRKEISRLLGQLGLDGKNKDLTKKTGTLLGKPEKQEPEQPQNAASKLVQFRKSVGR